MQPEATLQTLGDAGVTLLLFTIGLKLNIKSLFKTEVWGGACGHMLAITALAGCEQINWLQYPLDRGILLDSGQAVEIDAAGLISEVASLDTDAITAWDRGIVVFDKMPLRQAAKEMSR